MPSNGWGSSGHVKMSFCCLFGIISSALVTSFWFCFAKPIVCDEMVRDMVLVLDGAIFYTVAIGSNDVFYASSQSIFSHDYISYVFAWVCFHLRFHLLCCVCTRLIFDEFSLGRSVSEPTFAGSRTHFDASATRLQVWVFNVWIAACGRCVVWSIRTV